MYSYVDFELIEKISYSYILFFPNIYIYIFPIYIFVYNILTMFFREKQLHIFYRLNNLKS